MRIVIQADGFVLTEALRAYAEQRVATALGWAGRRMRKLAVSLSDINGPRGGIDKRCKIQLRLDGGQEVVIEDTEADLYVAIDRAAERADRALVRRVERMREFAHVRIEASAATGRDADPANDGSTH
ncbi:MAG TPA: HPF/RaiA family ribosome-associated protein [Telluria sp.]